MSAAPKMDLTLRDIPLRTLIASDQVGYCDWVDALAEEARTLSSEIHGEPFLDAKAEILERCAKSLRLIDDWDHKGCETPPGLTKADAISRLTVAAAMSNAQEAHVRAVDVLLDYINDAEIGTAFEKVRKPL